MSTVDEKERLTFAIKHPNTNEFSSRRLSNYDAPLYPSWIDDELSYASGRDFFGDVRLRIVWGQKLFRIAQGQVLMLHPAQTWEKGGQIYQVGYPRFIVQMKQHPNFCGLGDWDEKLQGPKPTTGLYTYLACVQTPEGNFRLPDTDFLLQLKGLNYNRMLANMYGESQEAPVADEATRWKIEQLRNNAQEIKNKRQVLRREEIKDAYKNSKIFKRHPREGLARDPYAESRKMNAQAFMSSQPNNGGKIVLTDL